ncbi:2-oxo acid dehydrogenase subunit E2 [Alicyclobacillaceae bacterium I2511]|nr:2-oxo acid dehydrogenase subunit E2 [Alicyclobacillaceae bacterium I2511]
MAIYEFKLPELGEGLHEGRIERWLVKPGDGVHEDDALAEVENDKSMVELPSPVDGKILNILVEAGSSATVGDILLTLDVAGAGNAAVAPEEDVKTTAVAQAGETATHPVQSEQRLVSDSEPASHHTHTEATGRVSREVLATPGVRKYAREQGVDLSQVTSRGENGKIAKADIDEFLRSDSATGIQGVFKESPIVKPLVDLPDAGNALTQFVVEAEAEKSQVFLEERVPLTNLRRLIAQAMVKSKYTAPHVTVMDEVDVTQLVQLRAELKPLATQRGVKLTYLPFVVKAMIAGLRKYPQINASLDEARQELVLKHYYHIGIATDTDRGLLVPVVKEADKKSLWTIAVEIADLAKRARNNQLGPSEMKGSTISITNIGSAGGMFFTPILNYPEVAILGLGRITERPILRDGVVVGAQMMALSLSFDHRVIDGALGQNFINEIKVLLGNPRLLMMEV